MNTKTLLSIFAFAGTLGCPIEALSAETRVLFCSDKEASPNVFDLYTIGADGSGLQRLTTTPSVSEWAPALAPDSQRVVYIAREINSIAGSLFVTDLQGTSPIQVPTTVKVLAVQWCDNHSLFFLGSAGEKWGQPYFDVRKINLDGTGEVQIYAGPFWVYETGADSFAWWPQGGRLFFSSSGSTPQEMAIRPRSGLATASAPDILFAPCAETLYASQDEPKVPGDLLIDHYDLALSPDGSRMAYCADHGTGFHRLYLRDTSGDCATQKRLSDAFCGDPHFAPDGSFVVFTRATISTYGAAPYVGNLIKINIDGSNEADLSASLDSISGRCAHPLVYQIGASSCEPFRLNMIQKLENGGMRFSWSCQNGVTYQVEASDNLVNWRNDLPGSLQEARPGDIELVFMDLSPGSSPRFYRVVATCGP